MLDGEPDLVRRLRRKEEMRLQKAKEEMEVVSICREGEIKRRTYQCPNKTHGNRPCTNPRNPFDPLKEGFCMPCRERWRKKFGVPKSFYDDLRDDPELEESLGEESERSGNDEDYSYEKEIEEEKYNPDPEELAQEKKDLVDDGSGVGKGSAANGAS